MEILGGIKPERISLLPSATRAPVSVDVSLEPPWLPLDVPQELYVEFVVVLLPYVPIRRLPINYILYIVHDFVTIMNSKLHMIYNIDLHKRQPPPRPCDFRGV